MKSTALVTMLMMVLVSAFCLITWNGFSEVWAKGPGFHVTTSRITQPGITQASPQSPILSDMSNTLGATALKAAPGPGQDGPATPQRAGIVYRHCCKKNGGCGGCPGGP